jgi:capsid assembly protease
LNFLPRMAARVIGTPLMVERARLETILSVLGPRIDIDAALPADLTETTDRRAFTVTPNGIGIIPVTGTLVKRAGAVEAASGLLSYTAIEEMILDAATDPAVKAILMDIDSPGGEVGGVFDLAELIVQARETKPIWAIADDAFSAAYLLASSAERIYLPQAAGIGSVGIIAVHVDESQKDAKEGRSYTTVHAGARKNDFSSHEPLSNDARSNLQQEVDRLYSMFVGVVAKGRNLPKATVRATEAGIFFGSNAVKVGLADRIGTIRDALVDLSAAIESPRKNIFHRAAQPPEQTQLEVNMPNDEKQAMDNPVAQATTPQPKPPEAAQETMTDPPLPQTTPLPHSSQIAQPQPSAQVIDLDKVRAEKEAQLRGEAQAIVDLCALAGMPDLAGGFIAQGFGTDAVRKKLTALRANGEDIQSHVMPGDGTRVNPETHLESNPVVAACQKMAKQKTMGGK